MKLNTRVRYALRLMVDIAQNSANGPVPLLEVARRQDVSRAYLAQLAIPLKNASLLKSTWGNRGGYVLGRCSREISIRDVVEAVDGPISLLDCILDPARCDRMAFCQCVRIWRDVNRGIVASLERYTLEDLIARPGRVGVSRSESRRTP